MNKPVNCRYFYGDYFRGKNKEECRLLEANPNVKRWIEACQSRKAFKDMMAKRDAEPA